MRSSSVMILGATLGLVVVVARVEALAGGFGVTAKKKKKPLIRPKKKGEEGDSGSYTPPSPSPATSAVEVVDKWGVPVVDEDAAVDFGARARAVVGDEPVSLEAALVEEPTLLDPYASVAEAWRGRCVVLQLEPLVLRVCGFLRAKEAEALVDLAKGGSTRCVEMAKAAGTFDAASAARRTSTTFYTRFAEPECLPLVARAAGLFAGATVHDFEEIQLARYAGGERFMWHEDAVPPPLLHRDRALDGGQRIATLLVYLSGNGDEAEGGATCFRDLGAPPPLRIRPHKGDALLFFPALRRPQGDLEPDDRTVHAAEPAVAEKWVTQLWLHEGPYPPSIIKDNLRGHDLETRLASDLATPPP